MANTAGTTYIKLCNDMPDHPKVAGLSDPAFRGLVKAMCAWSLGRPVRPRGRGMADLVREGLLIAVPGGLALGEVDDLHLGQGTERRRRTAIPLGVRTAVYERDGWACLHCGVREGLSLDHIYPWSRGGSDDFDNLQTLCLPCNSRKGALV